MAKRRIINTKFWSDTYVSALDPSEKLLFLYLLTNPYTNISGAYEISLRQVALDTGFDKDMIERILNRFEKDEKVLYRHGYIVVKNFIKHQEVNPKVQMGIDNELLSLPEDIKAIVYDSLSYPNLIKSNLIKSIGGDKSPPTLSFEEKIKSKAEEYKKLVNELASKDYLSPEKIHRIVLDEFVPYWMEKGEKGKKYRWEKEKVFDYQRRIRTWIKRYHEIRKDYTCKSDKWHGKGESCYCVRQEQVVLQKTLSEIIPEVRKLGASKRI